ncbi:protein CREG1 [Iris pallida]|uniref:Protein CREG1 n=1 Tax=Iris pallida TaxID=29817 RepID=A0AAX6DJI4_IRIPA|nr:protein CREG1 [Iris pallida]
MASSSSSNLLALILLFQPCFLFLSPASAAGRFSLPRKPDPSNAHATARWLASQNSWGVLSTISSDLGGSPFGNVVSYSDGVPGDGRGVPYFYLTQLDPTARDALKDERASFTISEYPLGTCKKIDPENPTCAKLTLSGKLKLVETNSSEAKFALSALFAKHAEMKTWPKNHKFQIFKLDIENLFLIDWFGGAKPLSPAQYLNPGMDLPPLISRA